jgi:galactokinase
MQKDVLLNVANKFVAKYGGDLNGVRTFFTPGRVNVIGEHIDYNGGYVFPCALDFGTYAAVRVRDDRKVRFATLNFDLEVSVDLDQNEYRKEDDWTNYPKGVIKMYEAKGHQVPGFDVLFYGNIPNGSGLSSSASLEVLTGTIIEALAGGGEDMIELVKLSQKAENEFVGVNCGIMDQFAVGMGKEDHAILLNCDTLEYEYAPFKLDGVKIVIGNTKKRRGLADSKYNERRSECDYALEKLQSQLDINYLCDMDMATFEANKHLIDNEVSRIRAEHAVAENERVKDCVKALNAGDLEAVGKLLNASHESLRDLYEVTGVELDTMVEEAWKIDGVLGARMTGAGFGGCTVALVKEEAVDRFIEEVGKHYEARTGLTPEFYVAGVGQGSHEVKGVI